MIALGCDHGGYQLMQEVIEHLKSRGEDIKNYGTFSEESTDYAQHAKNVVDGILSGECEKGILICGTGIGISIAANRHKGIRAGLCSDVFSAKATREHNDANILAMGGRTLGPEIAKMIVDTFLDTGFSDEERHVRRIKQIED